MSANRSQRQVRAAILVASTAEYAAWDLLVTCSPCDRHAALVPVVLLGSGRVASRVNKLRCSTCSNAPSEVLINNRLDGWRQVTVKLLGDGAYA